MNKTLIATALCTLLAAPSLALAAGNLVVNGSFEATAQGSGTWAVYNTVAGWTTVSGSGIEVRNNVAGSAFDGSNFVELDGHANTANTVMQQTLLTTTAGQLYDLGFAYSARPGVANAASNGLAVAWNGITLTTLAGKGAGQHNWLEVGLQVVGTGHDVLSFRATGLNDGLGGSLDNVSLTAAVPEPGTYALMVAGLLAVGFIARRRQGV